MLVRSWSFRTEQYQIKVCLDVQFGIRFDHQQSGALSDEVKFNLNETYSTKEFLTHCSRRVAFSPIPNLG